MIESVRNPFHLHVARILLIVDAFTTPNAGLRGWDTLARADFMLRYPTVLQHVLQQRGAEMPPLLMPSATEAAAADGMPLGFQFGPWDTRYYPVVARLVGTRHVRRRHLRHHLDLRVTRLGGEAAQNLAKEGWRLERDRARLISRHIRISGERMTRLIRVAIDELETAPVPVTP